MRTSLSTAVPEQVNLSLPGEALTRRAVTVITGGDRGDDVRVLLGQRDAFVPGFGHHRVDRLASRPGGRPERGRAADQDAVPVPARLHRRAAGTAAADAAVLRAADPGPEHRRCARPSPVRHRPGRRRRPDAADRLERPGPWLLRQIHAVCPPAAPRQPPAYRQPEAAAEPPALPAGLLARTRELDFEHRVATGRPISRDALRARLRIGRDRASALVAAVRAEAARTTSRPAATAGGRTRVPVPVMSRPGRLPITRLAGLG